MAEIHWRFGYLYPEEQGNWSEVPDESTPLAWLAAERMHICMDGLAHANSLKMWGHGTNPC